MTYSILTSSVQNNILDVLIKGFVMYKWIGKTCYSYLMFCAKYVYNAGYCDVIKLILNLLITVWYVRLTLLYTFQWGGNQTVVSTLPWYDMTEC
jgi:hypothetical protein